MRTKGNMEGQVSDLEQWTQEILADIDRWTKELEIPLSAPSVPASLRDAQMGSAPISELVFGIAHQIRNPLSVIRSQAQYLGSLVHDPKQRQVLEAIIRSTDSMNQRLSELIDFTQPLEISLQECLPDQVFENIVSLIRERCARQKVRIGEKYGAGFFPIRVDTARLQEALLQVILNAIEAMPKGGTLDLNIQQEQASRVTSFRISDSGIGISPEDMKDIFGPFFTTKSGSSGLGLSIAKRIMEAHHGSLCVDSRPGKGTTVMCDVPFLEGGPKGEFQTGEFG